MGSIFIKGTPHGQGPVTDTCAITNAKTSTDTTYNEHDQNIKDGRYERYRKYFLHPK